MRIDKDIITTDKPFELENGAVIHRFSHVVRGAIIGDNAMIGERCYIAGKSRIGNRTRIQNGNDVWDGVYIGNDVFIGPKCNLTNDHDPSRRMHRSDPHNADETFIGDDVTISTNVTIVAPCKIGNGASATILRDIEQGERVKWLVK